MAREPVFLDTVALIALAAKSDAWHDAAKAIERELAESGAALLTSEWVLTEFLNAGSAAPLRAAACRIVQRLRSSVRTTIVEVSTRAG